MAAITPKRKLKMGPYTEGTVLDLIGPFPAPTTIPINRKLDLISSELDIDDGTVEPIPASRALITAFLPGKAKTVPFAGNINDVPPWVPLDKRFGGEDHLWDSVYVQAMACAYVGLTSGSVKIKCTDLEEPCGFCNASTDGFCVTDFSQRNNTKDDAWILLTEMVAISRDPTSTPEMLTEKLSKFKNSEE